MTIFLAGGLCWLTFLLLYMTPITNIGIMVTVQTKHLTRLQSLGMGGRFMCQSYHSTKVGLGIALQELSTTKEARALPATQGNTQPR